MPSMRLLKITCLFLFTIVLIAGALFWRAGRVGESGVEAWLGDELKRAVARNGDFELAFEALDYQAPNRAILTRLRFGRSGASKPMVDVARAEIALAEVPKRGRPIVIRELKLDGPVVSIDAMIRRKPRSTTRPSTRPDLSTILTLQRVQIRGGRIDYDDGSGKGDPLSWSSLDADFVLESGRDAGWHRMKLIVDQPPLMQFDLAGELNLDEVAVREVKLSAKLDLADPSATRFFTPPMQRWIERHELRGACAIELGGHASMEDGASNLLDGTVTLTDGHMAAGEYAFALERLVAIVQLHGHVAGIDSLDVQAVGGTAKGWIAVRLDGPQGVQAQLELRNLQLEQLVRRQEAGKPHKLAGVLAADLAIDSSLPQLKQSRTSEGGDIVWGNGTIDVREGRLVELPVIGDVVGATRKVTSLVGAPKYVDKLDLRFDLAGRRFRCGELLYVGDLIAIRGEGDIGFKGGLDLRLNAGPLERLQQLLGPIGDLWGKVTDRVMQYHVTGTLKETSVKAKLGGGQ